MAGYGGWRKEGMVDDPRTPIEPAGAIGPFGVGAAIVEFAHNNPSTTEGGQATPDSPAVAEEVQEARPGSDATGCVGAAACSPGRAQLPEITGAPQEPLAAAAPL